METEGSTGTWLWPSLSIVQTTFKHYLHSVVQQNFLTDRLSTIHYTIITYLKS